MTDHGEWFKHDGGECPVPPETWVYVQIKGWWDRFGRADGFDWEGPCRYQVLNQWIPNTSRVAEARRDGIRLGLEAAMKTVCSAEVKAAPEAGIGHDSADWGRFAGLGEATDRIRALNPETIAREAVLDQLTCEAQADNMGYDKETTR